MLFFSLCWREEGYPWGRAMIPTEKNQQIIEKWRENRRKGERSTREESQKENRQDCPIVFHTINFI